MQIDAATAASSTLSNVISLGGSNSATLNTTGSNAIILSNAITFGGGGDNLTTTGTAPLTLGTLALQPVGDTLTQNATGTVTVNAITGSGVSGDFLTVAGTGTGNFSLPNASPLDTEPTIIATTGTGTVGLGNSTALGSGGVTVNSGTIQAISAGVTLANPLTFGPGAAVTFTGANSLGLTNIVLNGNNSIAVTGAGGTTINGNISGAGPTDSLTILGTGTLNLSAAETDTDGQTTILSQTGAGTLNVATSNALGGATGGGVTLTTGTLAASAAGVSLPNALSYSNNGAVTIGGTNAITLSGSITTQGTDTLTAADTGGVTLSGGTTGGGTLNLVFGAGDAATIGGSNVFGIAGVTLNGNNTLTVSDSAGTTISGNIGNTASTDTLTLAGNQTLNLPNTNTDTNKTVLTGGVIVNVGTSTSLGTGGVTLTSGTIEASTGGVNLANPLTFSAAGAATIGGTNALTLSGTLTLSGIDTLTVSNTGGTTITNNIGGSGTLVLAGNQTLNLPNTNTDTNPTTLSGGVIVDIGTATSLGSGTINVTNGTLTPTTGMTLANPLTYTGTAPDTLILGGASALVLSGPITLSGADTLNISDTGGVTITGTIGTGSLTLAGTQALSLPNADANAVAITLSGPTITLGTPTSLGTGTIIIGLGNGTIQSGAGAMILANPVTFVAGGTGTLGGSGAFTLTGTITPVGAGDTLNITDTGGVTITGLIGAGSLAFGGTQTLNLPTVDPNAAAITLNGPTVNVSNAYSLGTGTITLDAGTLVSITTPLNFVNAVALGPNATVTFGGTNAFTFTGIVAPTSGTDTFTINNGADAFTGVIGATATALVFVGPGALTLSNANTFTGGVTLNGIVATVGNNAAFGSGPLTLVNADTIQSTAAVTLPNAVNFNTGSALTVAGTQNITSTGIWSSQTAGAGSVLLTDTGILALQGNNTFSGSFVLNAGTLAISGASGMDPNVTSIFVNAQATFLIDDSTINLNNGWVSRPAPRPALTLAGGTFTLNGNTGGTTEVLGNITLDSGFSTFNLTKGAGGNLTLNANALNLAAPTAGSAQLINFVTPATGPLTGANPGNQLIFASGPAINNGILNYATVTVTGTSYDFASVDGAGNLLIYAGYTATSLGAGGITNSSVVKISQRRDDPARAR